MPFVQRVVEPIYLSRRSFSREDEGDVLLTDYELDTVTNNTLSNALRQLASLVVIANDIFEDLSKELHHVCVRSNKLRSRIQVVEEKVAAFDPKKVTVPESDICSFSLRTVHFSSCHELTTGLFSAQTRSKAVRCLYEAAAKTPVHVMRQLDRYRRDGHRSSRYFMCTPVLGQKRRRLKHRTDIEIETHTPAAVTELRRWTSSEALGDVTVAPDCSARVVPAAEDETDHRLPSPEEQVQAVANRFPSEVVSVDVSGRTFERMSLLRRSLIIVDADGTVRRRHSSRRRPRGRRRNTIAGTDRKELRQAVIGESLDEHETTDSPAMTTLDDIVVVRSASSDLLRTKDESPPDSKKSHFNSLKQWGKVKLKLIKSVGGDSGSKSSVSPEETNIYEMVSAKGKKADLKHERKASSSACNIPISTMSGAMSMAVKLRRNEEGVQRRRNGKDDALHSSSGNWSASSESGRTSIGSENTSTTTHQPKSTTTLSSAATSSNSLHHPAPSSSVCSRRKFLNTSTSSSVSEGTLTPDIIPDLTVPFADDGETSSIYSCDTEGYYTSFHLDSGLKTLKEEDGITSSPATPMHSTTALTNSPGRGNSTLTAENEYELFGKGSTSTTTSSAGTVCTTLMIGNNESSLSLALAPAVPERKSSLDRNSQMVVAMVHKQHGEVSDSPDSGHNTSSSPVDSACSPHGTLTGRSSEYEFSESDLEGVDRLERIRVKTTINSSRIPSMCVITPPPSDDETSLSHYVPSNVNRTRVPSPTTTDRNNFLETDFGSKNIHNLKLVIPQQNSEMSPARHASPSRTLEKQISTESDRSSENETVKAVSPVRAIKPHMNGSFHNQSQGNELTRDDGTLKAGVSAPSDSTSKAGQSKFAMNPFNNVLDKVKGVLSHKKGQSPKVGNEQNLPASEEKPTLDPGDYVTIADVRDKRKGQPGSPLYSNDFVKSAAKMVLPVRDTEYVSLNELPVNHSSSPTNVLVSPSDSLERKRRQGARVTLDSEGKVVYSSDSLRRNKGSHTTFEPGPYVKESTTSPTASPLPSHRVPKSNIRPVTLLNQGRNGPSQPTSYSKPSSPIPTSKKSTSPSRSKPTSPTSPLLGKVIIRAGGKSSPMTRVASPTSTLPIIASTSGRPMSPQSARGAYVNMQLPDESQRRRCVSPAERTTDEDEEGSGHDDPSSKVVMNPNLLGRKFYGSQVKVDPNLFASSGAGQLSRQPKDTERARVLNNAELYRTHLHSALVVLSSATSSAHTGTSKGKPSSYMKQPPPPRYISPPPVQSSLQYNGGPSYWTLPNRRTQEDGRISSAMQTTQQDGVGSGRYNTIASANSWNDRGYYPEETQGFSRTPPPGYGRNNPSVVTRGANLKSSQQNTPPPPPSVCNANLMHQHQWPAREGPLLGQKYTTPMPASIPTVPRNTAYLNGGMQSSTPTKKDGTKVHVMDMSLNLSPIHKNAPHQYGVKPPQQVLYTQQNAVSSLNRPTQSRNDQVKRPDAARLLSKPKSSMTAEELFAAIHKSKKKLNIKTDTDSYSRSASPSCSSMTSLSPGSSESSINGNRNGKPETGTLGVENVGRNRHSWSPNSNELLDNRGYLDQHTSSPISQAGSRQSWACDRLGPTQQTSMNDFKRLLLQHGPKSPPSSSLGSPSGRMSAAEQLRLSRQQKLTPVPPPPSVPVMNGSYLPRSPAEKRTNGSKLLHSPRSLATWRFASPRTDVLSSTILEDRAEEEKAANSPTQETSPAQAPKLQSSSHTLISSSVRRPLNLSFNDTSKDSSARKDPLKPTDVTAILHQYRRESSPKARGEPHQSGRITPTEQTTPVNSTNKLASNNRTLSQDLLSPSNVKENVNTNRQVYNLSATQAANYKARQLFLQQTSALNSQQPSSPRIQVGTVDKQQRSNFYSSPGRSILGSLETKSPSKSTLETAL